MVLLNFEKLMCMSFCSMLWIKKNFCGTLFYFIFCEVERVEQQYDIQCLLVCRPFYVYWEKLLVISDKIKSYPKALRERLINCIRIILNEVYQLCWHYFFLYIVYLKTLSSRRFSLIQSLGSFLIYNNQETR